MKTVFNIHNAFKQSQLEISSNTSYDLLYEYLVPYKKDMLPEDVFFEVATGKKSYDLIRLFQSGEFFFSQRFIDVLAHHVDMSDKCYPIKIKGIEEQYYVIYNIEESSYLNKEKSMFDEEPPFYCKNNIRNPLFAISNTRHFVVTDKLKNEIINNKLTNIEFTESFLCTREEYKEWRKSH